ncbi:NosD domain-containing protein [Methanosarcina hadiensis]|uniref:NosD domain-containing protein n=1 Tax=Methanosarcina hadiensis TaxID=3078083 RepID=UPI00397778CA
MDGTASAGSTGPIIYVDAMGSGNYTTIQDAVNNAAPGNTIIVYPGTYNEIVDINVANLSILSYSGNPEDTIVRHIGSGHNFGISASNVTISGFNITGKNSTGIYMSGVSGVNISNNKLSGIGCGVQVESSNSCILVNNTVNDSDQYGFYLQSSRNCTLDNNAVSNTASHGIYLLAAGYCNLTSNTVSDTGSDGVQFSSSNNCTMANNTITNISGNGIYATFSTSCNFTGNTVSNIDYEGISLLYSNNCTLAGNIISSTEHYGIYTYSSSGCNFTENTVSNVYYDGIYLYQLNGCTLTGNTISNSEDGIHLYNSSNCNLTDNDISNTYDDGIYLFESSSCNLSGNRITESDYGLYISHSRNCTLTNNTANSGIYGLFLASIENSTFKNNIMSGNQYNFELEYDNEHIDLDNVTTGNIIDTSNLVDGKPIYYFERESNPSIGRDAGVIYCINCRNVEIKDLVLQNNTYGVLLYNTSSNIQNNTINNTIYGVGIVSSHDVRVSDSRFENSGVGVMAQETRNITVTNNNIQDSMYGIATIDSENCTLKKNSVLNSTTVYSLYRFANSDPVKGEENDAVQGKSSAGFNLVQAVRSYGFGVYSLYSSNLSIEDNTIDQVSFRGIYIEECQNSSVIKNSIRNVMDTGIYTEYSSDVKLLENTVQNVTGEFMLPAAGNPSLVGVSRAYGCGIYFGSSQNISLIRNSVRDIACAGIYSGGSSGVELLDNMVQNVKGETRTYDSGDSFSVSSSLVGDRRIMGYGIYLYDLENLTVKGNTVRNCYPVWGMHVSEPVNASFERNTYQNCQGGLVAVLGENLSIRDCSAINCTSGGILVINTAEVAGNGYTVSGCTVEGSDVGLLVTGEGNFSGNNLSRNSYGLILYNVNNSLVYGNKIEQNSVAGLAFDLDRSEINSHAGFVNSMESPASSNNIIYNNYLNNINNTLLNSEASNTWNTSKTAGRSIVSGPYLGGNYWANPNGTGFSQNCTDADRDGIADSAYEIKNGTYDNLPLTIIPPTTSHRGSANYVPSGGNSGVTGIDSAQKRVVAGSQTTFSFNNPVSGVLGLSFKPLQYSGNVIVRIEVLGNGTSGEMLEGEVYRLMNILVGNERFESRSNINGASISFRVPKSWVEENNIDVSTIRINRFHNEEWDPLVTEMAYEDKEYYYFTAETLGFSRYAITGDKLSKQIITPAEQEENETITGEEQTTRAKRRTPGFESAFAVPGILASVFFARKRIMR